MSRKRTISPITTSLPLVWASEVSRVLLMAPRAWLTTDWLAFSLYLLRLPPLPSRSPVALPDAPGVVLPVVLPLAPLGVPVPGRPV